MLRTSYTICTQRYHPHGWLWVVGNCCCVRTPMLPNRFLLLLRSAVGPKTKNLRMKCCEVAKRGQYLLSACSEFCYIRIQNSEFTFHIQIIISSKVHLLDVVLSLNQTQSHMFLSSYLPLTSYVREERDQAPRMLYQSSKNAWTHP